ncbi:MAG: hypothetical protein QNL88_04250, partial [Acidobacteriota bacterium]|nr:hypothetical protein [Acidobacteriota bacterium]
RLYHWRGISSMDRSILGSIILVPSKKLRRSFEARGGLRVNPGTEVLLLQIGLRGAGCYQPDGARVIAVT